MICEKCGEKREYVYTADGFEYAWCPVCGDNVPTGYVRPDPEEDDSAERPPD